LNRKAHWSLVVFCAVAVTEASAQQDPADTSLVGEWGPLHDTKLTNPRQGQPTDAMTVIHAILLHTGKVLCVDFLTSDPDTVPARVNRPDVILFDPTSEQFELVWETGPNGSPPNEHVLYCSGHTILSNGMVLIQGGSRDQQ